MAGEESGITLPPGGGRSLAYPRGGRLELKVRGADTGGAYALLEFTIPPGGTGSPPHYHVATEEALYLVEGELTLRLGERTARATAGSCILVPRGVVHTFTNTGAQPARLLIVVSPADFERYFVELGELVSASPDGQLDPETVRRVANKHGQRFVDQPRGQ